MLTDFELGMDFGRGVDELTGENRGFAVVKSEPTELTGASGQEILTKMVQVETMEDLNQELGLSVAAEAKFGLFGGNAKFDFARSSSIHSYSNYLLVSISVRNSFRQMLEPRLTDNAAELLRKGRVERFRERFGDSFVQGMLTGGEYFALLEIESKDAQEQQEIDAALSAEKMGTFKLDAQFNQKLEHVTKNQKLQIRVVQRGGTETAVPQNSEEIIDRFVNFASMVAGDAGIAYAVELADYTILDLPEGPNFVDTQFARELLQSLSALRSELRRIERDIEFILLNPEQFEGITDAKADELNQVRHELNSAIRQSVKAASRCANDVGTCVEQEDIAIPSLAALQDLDLPERVGAPAIGPPPRGRRGTVTDLAGKLRKRKVATNEFVAVMTKAKQPAKRQSGAQLLITALSASK